MFLNLSHFLSIRLSSLFVIAKVNKNVLVSIVLPLHSEVSWGYCNNHGIFQGPEWRTACWKKMKAVARGWKTVVEVGNHSCDRNASSVPL